MLRLSLTHLSCAQRTEKWTFSIVPYAWRDRQTGNFQGPVCVSHLCLTLTDGPGTLAIFTVPFVPSCFSETPCIQSAGAICLFLHNRLHTPISSRAYKEPLLIIHSFIHSLLRHMALAAQHNIMKSRTPLRDLIVIAQYNKGCLPFACLSPVIDFYINCT